MILFTIIMICLLSSLFRPRFYGFYGPRFYHRPYGFMRGPRMRMHRPMGPMHGPRRF